MSAILVLSAYGVADAQPAPGLVAVLQGLREVNTSFIVAWSADPRAPRNTDDKVSALKVQILRLDPGDREAVLFWLRSHGRDALHQRGVNDTQIGPPLYPIDYDIAWTTLPAGFVNPTPMPIATSPSGAQPPKQDARGVLVALAVLAPPATTQLPTQMGSFFQGTNSVLKSATGTDILGLANLLVTAARVAGALATSPAPATPQPTPPPDEQWIVLDFGRERNQPENEDIVVNRGIAGIRNNAESAACVAFANHASRAVREVDFDLTFLDASDFALQTTPLRRTGDFAPGAEITAPHDLVPSELVREDANCVTTGGAAAGAGPNPALARTVALTYAVRRIVFDDGTVWQRAGTNTWPTAKP